jgi:hypothetical protein
MDVARFRAQIEKKLPSAFMTYTRALRGRIPTGISVIDSVVEGIPLHALTEICGSSIASSGKTSVLTSLLAQASRDHFCVLVDANDSFHPETGHAAGIHFSRLLWVRCGKSQAQLRRLEQAFKVTDILLQSCGFGVIAVDLSGIGERSMRKIPLSTWFRFSRVVEKQPAALVFIEQEPHAASCAGLVLRVQSEPTALSGKLITSFDLKMEVVRDGTARKPVGSVQSGFTLKTQWA